MKYKFRRLSFLGSGFLDAEKMMPFEITIKGIVASPIYEIRMDKYNKRINEIDQKLPVLEAMLKGKKIQEK